MASSSSGMKSKLSRKLASSRHKMELDACFMLDLLGFLSNPEDGGDIVLQNVNRLSADYMVLWSKSYNTS
jgi:hypothetical protein